MQNRSDIELIAAYFKGDNESLEILIKRYLKPIYGFAYRYVGNKQDAEDITQKIFIKVWRHLKKFNRNKSFKTWIFAVAKNTAIDFLKKKKTAPFSEENKFIETLTDPAPLPQELLEKADLAQMLSLAAEKLSPQYRKVLSLRYNDYFNFREIAESLGEPLNTVKSWHRRAMIALRNLMQETL